MLRLSNNLHRCRHCEYCCQTYSNWIGDSWCWSSKFNCLELTFSPRPSPCRSFPDHVLWSSRKDEVQCTGAAGVSGYLQHQRGRSCIGKSPCIHDWVNYFKCFFMQITWLTTFSSTLLFFTPSFFFLQWLRNCKDTFPRCPGDSVVTCQPGDSEEKVRAPCLQVTHWSPEFTGKHTEHLSNFFICASYLWLIFLLLYSFVTLKCLLSLHVLLCVTFFTIATKD